MKWKWPFAIVKKMLEVMTTTECIRYLIKRINSFSSMIGMHTKIALQFKLPIEERNEHKNKTRKLENANSEGKSRNFKQTIARKSQRATGMR